MRPIRVLYVTERFDGPYRYRCQQACEQLRRDGAVANVLHVDDDAVVQAVGRYGVVVLFRLPWTERVEAVIAAARRAGVPVLFEIDDLTFDPIFAELMPFRKRYEPDDWARAYGKSMVGLRRTFDATDAFIGSTAELAEQAVLLGKVAHVHRNVVPEIYLRSGRLTERVRRALRTRPTIGYFSGSDTHDEDFASIAPALERVLGSVPEARLLVVGYLDFSTNAPLIERRTTRLPYMHWRDFAVSYAACHVVLAPLAVKNAFTDSKSALKFFEAGAFYTPTIATPVREMREAITDGETGFFADSEDEWARSIQSALSAETASRVGRSARSAVELRHSRRSASGALLSILSSYAVTAGGRAPPRSPLDPPDETGRARTLGRLLRPGHAARDLTRIVRAVLRTPGPDLDPERLERFLRAIGASEDARRRAAEAGVGIVVPSASRPLARSEEVSSDGALPGESRSRGNDPWLARSGLSLDPKRYRYALLRLRTAAASPTVRVQIFWKDGPAAAFTERASATRTLPADGLDRTILLDLTDDATRSAWFGARQITEMRIDPMDRPGSFRIEALVLMPEGSIQGAALPQVAAPELLLELDLERPTAAQELRDAQGSLAAEDRLRIGLRGSSGSVRQALGRILPAEGAAVEELFATGQGSFTAVVTRGARPGARAVDVVVPIWNARPLVLRCLESVKRHAPRDCRIVAIDDASTDPEMARTLEALARGDDRFVHLENAKNLGFVRTANRGLAHAGGHDVLLLNSDTEVYEGFLEGLRDAAYSGERVGMVSPLSNNATICSVPEFCRENTLPEGMTGSDMARVVRGASERRRPELVTPHGFCLYLRGDCLGEVGPFDAERFGRGFGEENDLGERAKSLGWKIVLADDVYVFHVGKASFEGEGRELERRHAVLLEQRHPGYHSEVAAFVRDNPLLPVHADLSRHLARSSHELLPAPLLVLHASPFAPDRGGVEYCVSDLVRAMELPRVVVLYPEGDALEVAEVFDGAMERPSFYRYPIGHAPGRFCHEHPGAILAMREILDLHRISMAHLHHSMFLPLSLGALLRERRVPYLVTVHDFYPACPSFNFLDLGTTTPCCPDSCGDMKRTVACQRALFAALGEPLPADPARFVVEHRRAHAELLKGAHRAIFPSPSTRTLTGRVLPLVHERTAVVPHGIDATQRKVRAPRGEGPLRVALLGQIAYPAKGAASYLRAMALSADVPIEWHVFGRTDLFDFEERLAALEGKNRIVRHGGYARERIQELLSSARIDVGLLLPAWPESFSYTLSELEAAGLPVVARRIGALLDRLDGAPHAVLVLDAEEAAAALSRLAKDRDSLEEMASRVPSRPGARAWGALHRDLYLACAAESQIRGPASLDAPGYRRLNALAVVARTVDPEPARVTRPSAEHAAAWWYPYAERAKPYVPESVRHLVRRRLAGDGSVTVVRFRLPSRRARILQELSLDRRYVGTTQVTSHGSDPQLLLSLPRPLDPARVQLIRFNVWCSSLRPVHAQIYFRHEGATDFDEAHSITVRLDGRAAAWQEYVVDLETSERAARWYEGGPIVGLRFDPIDAPGPVGLGEIALCARSREPRALTPRRRGS